MSKSDIPDPNVLFPVPNCKTVTYVKPQIQNPNILVGDFTYFGDTDFEKHVTHHYDFCGDKLIIGKFCQIARCLREVLLFTDSFNSLSILWMVDLFSHTLLLLKHQGKQVSIV